LWLRVDLADRLAAHAHKVRAAGAQGQGLDLVDRDLATSLGLPDAVIDRLMAEVGFRAGSEGGWAWRGNKAARAAPAAPPRPGNAFAALAGLKS
jgi:ATP-dependent RNA helicase SUPV3L1/SUV3